MGKRRAISNWLHQFKTEIDLKNLSYKTSESFLGIFKWRESRPLPKVDYVLIFKQLFAKCESCSVEEYENNIHSYYQVSLVYGNNRRIIIEETKNEKEAFAMGKQLATGLNTKLKDSASNRRKSAWLI